MNRKVLNVSAFCFLSTILLMAILKTVVFDLQISQTERTILAVLALSINLLVLTNEILQKKEEKQEQEEEEEEEEEKHGD